MLLKRFTSKDEKRRRIAGVNVPGETLEDDPLALENHLNYVGRMDQELEHPEAYGLAALFNSTFMDRYFRCISGNTQVNATEIHLLKLPSRKTIRQIGHSFLKTPVCDQPSIDGIVDRCNGDQFLGPH